MTKTFTTMLVLVMSAATIATAGEKQQETRDALDANAKETLEKLFEKNEASKKQFDESYGYAVFNNLKTAIMLAAGRGKGVAVHKESGKKTYMKMGSLGVNIGYGIKKMQVVFIFENQKAFDNFVNNGWRADAAAEAAVVEKGGTAAAEFRNGIAAYEFTDKGLMLQANLSGTKYYKSKKLNRGVISD